MLKETHAISQLAKELAQSQNPQAAMRDHYAEGSPAHAAHEHILDNWKHMDTHPYNDDSICFDEDDNLADAEKQPSEFDKWLENHGKEYEDPSLEAAARWQAEEQSLSFSLYPGKYNLFLYSKAAASPSGLRLLCLYSFMSFKITFTLSFCRLFSDWIFSNTLRRFLY